MNNETVTYYEQLDGKLRESEEFPVIEDENGRYTAPNFFNDIAEVSPLGAVTRKVTTTTRVYDPEVTKEE